MKTTCMKINSSSSTFGLLIAFLFLSTFSFAQDIQVKGVVKAKVDEVVETLSDVNIFLKGTAVGTTTDRKGKFTFPRKLKVGDILIFSYLGYEKREIIVNRLSKNLTVILKEDSNVILGATNTSKRYKSKRSKQ